MQWFNGRLEARTGDITQMQVDAIVNAANSSLMGGGGVDGAIHRAGGATILEECRAIRTTRWPEGLPTGEAVVTTGGKLPCQYVIHTVGPVWYGGGKGEASLLANAYAHSLAEAVQLQIQSLAFPAISTGIYGYPMEKAAPVVWQVLSDNIRQHPLPEKIVLVFFSQANLQAFLDALPTD